MFPRLGKFLSCNYILLYLDLEMFINDMFHLCSLLDISLSFDYENIYYLARDFLMRLLLMLTLILHSFSDFDVFIFLLRYFFVLSLDSLFHLEFYYLVCQLIVVTDLFLHVSALQYVLLHFFLALYLLFCYS